MAFEKYLCEEEGYDLVRESVGDEYTAINEWVKVCAV